MLTRGLTTPRVFLVLVAVFGVATVTASVRPRPLGDNSGYAPRQPIDFSHRLHAGELGVDCLYCHYGARSSKHAGIPPTSVCLNCHSTVSSSFDALLEERALAAEQGREPERIVSDDIRALYAAMGLDDELQPTGEAPRPVPWVRVHNMQDFVAFDHSLHVSRGLACATCHGPVQTMERVRQESDLSMGWCVNCHRSHPDVLGAGGGERLADGEHVSTDCGACHY